MTGYPLRVFVHRVLAVRLGVAAVAVAAGVGLVVYAAEAARVDREVVELGRTGVRTLEQQVGIVAACRQIDVVSALREVLASAAPERYQGGRFVYVQVYDGHGAVLSEMAEADHRGMAAVKAFVAARPFTFPLPGADETVGGEIDGARYVLASGVVADPGGRAVAYARGMFAIAPAAFAQIRRTIVRSTLASIGIVLAVAVLLYPVILRLTRRLADSSTRLLEANLETIAVLGSAVAKRDSDTDAHNYRVTIYATRLAEALGLPPDQVRLLIKGSFLHDVGKIGIPDRVLLKPGKLDQDEFLIMKTHVDAGADIVERSSWLREGMAVVGCHHEWFDGGGYPRGLAGPAIPMVARIFAVADVFDALTSHRPYKPSFGFDESMAVLHRERGTHFDPQAIDAFDRLARPLYDRCAGKESGRLRDDLVEVASRYFSSGLETLRY